MIQLDQPKLVANWVHQFFQKNMKRENRTPYENGNYKKDLTSQMYSQIRGLLQLQDQENSSLVNDIQVNVLKGFTVVINGKRVYEGWGKRKAKQLFTYLILQQTATRDELCDVFWPEIELESARNRLRVALHHLKKLLEEHRKENTAPIIGTDRGHVFINGKVESDLLHYLEKIKHAFQLKDEQKKKEQYIEILLDVTENAIPGFYDEWFLNLRSKMEKDWAEMALSLTTMFVIEKDFTRALFYAKTAMKYHDDESKVQKRIEQIKSLGNIS